MKPRPHLNGGSLDDRIVMLLRRGPLTEAQIDARIGLTRQGSRAALRVLLATGQVVAEPYEGSPTRKHYRAVTP